MVFPNPKSPAAPPPPGLPEVETPPPGAKSKQTQLDRIETVLLAVHTRLGLLLKALDEEDDDPEQRTLDGAPAGKPRDQTQSLG